MWCIQTIDAIFRTCMYDVLDLYDESYDPKRPLVCLDEKPKQLLGEKRLAIPMSQEVLKNTIMNTLGKVQQTYSLQLNTKQKNG